MPYVLTVDIGTGGVHASLTDAAGGVRGNAYRETIHRYDPASKGLELDAEELFAGVKLLMREAAAGAGVRAADVSAVAVTSQRHGCVFLDGDDAPLAAFPSTDTRADGVVDEFRDESARVYAIAARMPNRCFPMLRLAWLRKNKPELAKRVAAVMMLNEYVSYRLTGVAASEWTNAAESLLFDPETRSWSGELADIFNARELRLSRLVAPGSVTGALTAGNARELGLDAVPVVLAASDTQSALLGCGDLKPGDAVAVNGSTTPVLMLADSFIKDEKRRIWSDICCEGKWGVEGNCSHSGLSHRKLLDHFLALARRIPGAGELRREQLYELFDAEEFAPDGLIAHWGPRICDYSRPSKRLTLSAENNEVNVFASLPWALMENLAFAITGNIRQLEQISGRRAERIFLTGGGSASRRLRNAVAALNGDSEVLLTRDLETTSRGAAIQAWIALGTYPDSARAIGAMGGERWAVRLPASDDKGVRERYAEWIAATGS